MIRPMAISAPICCFSYFVGFVPRDRVPRFRLLRPTRNSVTGGQDWPGENGRPLRLLSLASRPPRWLTNWSMAPASHSYSLHFPPIRQGVSSSYVVRVIWKDGGGVGRMATTVKGTREKAYRAKLLKDLENINSGKGVCLAHLVSNSNSPSWPRHVLIRTP